ncbi:hypothetical protein [Streptomyces sp. DHE17-7]|uniref:hypothetical protein n=1 Tax=Streptomyces sp. DHE17-7 TaxID=2759949 RepID=UPI0022EB8CC7|nr:hypothetical protein [Streptomyces sp. DHE17-7]
MPRLHALLQPLALPLPQRQADRWERAMAQHKKATRNTQVNRLIETSKTWQVS